MIGDVLGMVMIFLLVTVGALQSGDSIVDIVGMAGVAYIALLVVYQTAVAIFC